MVSVDRRMGKRLRSVCNFEEEEEGEGLRNNNIDALPNELVEDIVSRLKTREAAATSLVSRKWKKLLGSRGLSWEYASNLVLDFTNKKYELNYIQGSVGYVLNKHQVELDHLRIAFNDDNPDRLALTFQYWFTIANAKQVKSLDFKVKSSVPFYYNYDRNRCLPAWMAMTLNSWERLTCVSLKSVVVDGEDLEVLLSISPNLESLLVEGARLGALDIREGIIPKLKRLVIQYCSMSWIRIHSAPNLEYFKHVPARNRNHMIIVYSSNENISVMFDQVPKLETIYLGGPVCRNLLWNLSHYVPHLQKLELELDVWCCDLLCWGYHTTIPQLQNIKQLELNFTSTRQDAYDAAIAIIHACPCLEKLAVNYVVEKHDRDDAAEYDLDHGSNQFLIDVHVVGWSGMKSEVCFIRYLVRASPNLQRLSIPTSESAAAQLLIAHKM